MLAMIRCCTIIGGKTSLAADGASIFFNLYSKRGKSKVSGVNVEVTFKLQHDPYIKMAVPWRKIREAYTQR